MKNILPGSFYEILERAGICTPKQILVLSLWDIQKLTKLKECDILLIKSIVSKHVCSQNMGTLVQIKPSDRISTGCNAIDKILNGGFRRGTVTEIYGEGGSGKTQIALQCAALYSTIGCAYICTERNFPVNRFNQINRSIFNLSPYSECGNHIFVEHSRDSNALLSCIRVQLHKLLSRNEISVLIIDSIAAPFRCEHNCYLRRAEELKEFATKLYTMAQQYNLAVICINQVTASFNSVDTILPSLGLVWSNMVTYRFQVKKTNSIYKKKDINEEFIIRELIVIVAPDLPNKVATFLITSNGVESLEPN